jgi:hypothetical protein
MPDFRHQYTVWLSNSFQEITFFPGASEKYIKYSYKKKQHEPPSKKAKRGKHLSPRNRKACHSIGTALLQSIVEIGTQSTMKSSMKNGNKRIERVEAGHQ